MQYNMINHVPLRDALSAMGTDSGKTIEEAQSSLIGAVSAFQTYGISYEDALSICMECFPKDFRLRAIPKAYLNIKDWKDTANIISFNDLIDGLPQDIHESVWQNLLNKYLSQIGLMHRYAENTKNPKITLFGFGQIGNQYIADFSVGDMDKVYDAGKMNFHLQNTSQWLYAGCILVQDGIVSTHT